MMRERETDAVSERAYRQTILRIEHDGTVALVGECVGIELAELIDQAALAMEVDRVAVIGTATASKSTGTRISGDSR